MSLWIRLCNHTYVHTYYSTTAWWSGAATSYTCVRSASCGVLFSIQSVQVQLGRHSRHELALQHAGALTAKLIHDTQHVDETQQGMMWDTQLGL